MLNFIWLEVTRLCSESIRPGHGSALNRLVKNFRYLLHDKHDSGTSLLVAKALRLQQNIATNGLYA